MPGTVTKQLADRWSLIKTHIHKAWGIKKRALKPQLKPLIARNLKAVYMRPNQLHTRYIDTSKITHSHSNILLFSRGFLILTLTSETLWQAPHRCPPWGIHLPTLAEHRQGHCSIWTHSRILMIFTSSVWCRLWEWYFRTLVWKCSFQLTSTFKWSPTRILQH